MKNFVMKHRINAKETEIDKAIGLLDIEASNTHAAISDPKGKYVMYVHCNGWSRHLSEAQPDKEIAALIVDNIPQIWNALKADPKTQEIWDRFLSEYTKHVTDTLCKELGLETCGDIEPADDAKEQSE